MTESDVTKLILLEAPKYKCVLMRNNVGMLQDKRGQYVRYGLGNGTSDLIGWRRNHIVDGEEAIFLAVEVKTKRGAVTKAQQIFIEFVIEQGGIAGVCRSVEDFVRLVG